MPVIFTVSYPREAAGPLTDSVFNLKYYLDKHMPLVSEKFGPYGLKSWTVITHEKDPSSQFVVQAILTFDTAENFKSATTSEGAADVFGDIKNFTKLEPVRALGDVVGTS